MGGYGSGPATAGSPPGPFTMEILGRLWRDVEELQATIDREGITVYDDKRGSIAHPALKPLRDAQLMVARIESRLPKQPVEKGKLASFIETSPTIDRCR